MKTKYREYCFLGFIFFVSMGGRLSLGGDLVADLDIYWPPTDIPKPKYLETIIDPVFKTKITRITGDMGVAIPNMPGKKWGKGARIGYPKIQVWNADESIIRIGNHWGGCQPLFLDGQSYMPLFCRRIGGIVTESRWHPQDPNLIVYIDSPGSAIGYWNVRTNSRVVVATFKRYRKCHFGPWEGNLSNDGRLVVLSGERKKDNVKVAFVIDLREKIKYPDIEFSQSVKIDWASISPLGNYVVVNAKFSGKGDQTQVYDLQGNKVGSLWEEYGRPSHYDLAVDENGEEVAVGVCKVKPYLGRVIKRRLTDGRITVLTKGGWPSHTTTRNIRRPGWAFAICRGSKDSASSWRPYWNELLAVKLDGTRVERICHFHSSFPVEPEETKLWRGAYAIPSPTGSRALFCSDWNEKGQLPQVYVVDFRDKIIR